MNSIHNHHHHHHPNSLDCQNIFLHMESPFERYLDTNYVPSASDRAAIEKLLQGSVQEVRDIHAEIEVLCERMGSLAVKSKEQEQFIARHRALLDPVRALPDEIMCAIFDHCVPARYPFPARGKPTANAMSAAEAPMLLTFVCKRWRQVALDHSSLWNEPHISIPLPLHDAKRWNEMARSTARIAQLWISRAKDRLLKVTVMSTAGRFPEEGLKEICEAIAPTSTRWEALELEVTDGFLNHILRLPSHSVPNLKRVHLSMFFREIPEVMTLNTGDNLLGGPSVSDVSIQGRCFPPTGRFADLPFTWSRLSTFWVPTVMLTDVEVIDILRKATSLAHCCLFLGKCTLSQPLPQDRRVTAANLDNLQLISQGKSMNLTRSLILPRLSSVNFVGAEDEAQ